MGVTPIIFYDPLGRAVGTLHPDHTYEKTVFDPWKQSVWDRNDTYKYYNDEADNPDPTLDPDLGGFFARLDDSLYGTDHYPNHHGNHAGTESTVYFDSLGRPFLSVAKNKLLDGSSWVEDTRDFITHTRLDIEGNALQVTVSRDTDTTSALMLDVMTTDYDVAGRPIRTDSPDAGIRILFPDIAGNPIHTWDSRDHHFQVEYDILRRPVATWMTPGENSAELIAETVYGDEYGLNPPGGTPVELNLRGQVYQTMDGSGETTFNGYDFKGNPLSVTNQLAADYKNTIDWSETVTLEEETFTTSMEYDALSRVIAKTTPDGNTTIPTYNEAGFLEGVDVIFADSTAETPFVVDIDYNARGQRTAIEYGNGAVTEYEYDEKTFRLTNLTTTSDSTAIQDLTFTFDPVGNIEQIADAAQDTVFFENQQVSAQGNYSYDALYRLIKASGREHPAQQPQPFDQLPWEILHSNQDGALINYGEAYAYDEIGNILQMAHTATDNNWTQDYTYASTSNRLTQTQIGQTPLSYTHDAHGNMNLPHLTVQTWNHLDQLKSSSTQSVGSGTPETTYYVYDAAGQRVRKVTENYAEQGYEPTRKCETLYIGGFEIYRDYVNDVLENERETLHIDDDTKRIAMVETKTWIDGDEITSPAHLQRYQLSNHLGSATIELDEDAQVITYEEYYPFGGTSFHSAKSSTGFSQKRYRYNGKEKDEETGLYYYGARYYAAWLGRWTACDPAGFMDGPNVYVYVRNNPVKLTDPGGTQTDESETTHLTNHALKPPDIPMELSTGDIGSSRNNHEFKPEPIGPLKGTSPVVENDVGSPEAERSSNVPSEKNEIEKSGASRSRSASNPKPSVSKKEMPFPHEEPGMPEVSPPTKTGYFEEGYLWRQYQAGLAEVSKPNNPTWVRVTFFALCTLAAPVAHAEESTISVINTPNTVFNKSRNAGEHAAQAVVYADRGKRDKAVVAGLKATAEISEGFVAAGSIAVSGQKLLPAPKLADHHIFPTQFRKFFNSRGIDIDNYTVTLGEKTHLKGIHGNGLGSLPEEKWNQSWMKFIQDNPNATAKDIYQKAGEMMDRYELSGLPIHPYRQ